ncbi:conserved hypothetical protein [Culex quinquefasciatus]|uniref:F-box domain-containing protein n=1 Tax=Culex quinquefasciatus TaxID=7176 RepID=B0XB26_CULQU|nr:conserved hypothetical protein [Culex quinquefasciatus]|eukprot:XP_001866848.1 conserved hypothetical protein [Culex quinquefasciatus]
MEPSVPPESVTSEPTDCCPLHCDHQASLPPEVWELIFLNLDAVALARVRLTCVRWRDIVDLSSGLAERFELTFPKNIWMDGRYEPENLFRAARNAQLEDCTIVTVDHWWPALARRLVRLELVNCTLPFPVLLGMLREAPNLRQLHLDVNMPGERGDLGWSFDDTLTDFVLPRLGQLKASFANRQLGRICPNLKLFGQLEPDNALFDDFGDMDQFVAETQGSLLGLVFALTPKLVEAMRRMDRLRLHRVQIQNQCESWLVVQLTQFQRDLVEIEATEAVLTREDLCQIGRNVPNLMSLSVTVRPTEEEEDGVGSPSYLHFMPSLEILTVHHAERLIRIDFGRLANPRLRHVSLNDTRDCVRLKEYLGRCGALQRLDMHACRLDSWAEVFGAVQQAPALLFLHLSCIRVQSGLDCLTERVGRLQYLTLRACDVTKGMLLHLIAVCPGLRQVQLGLMVTVDDAVVLALCLGLPRLALLIVFRCPVTDESVGSLVRFGGDALQHVAIVDCERVTAGAIAKLGERFRVLYGA